MTITATGMHYGPDVDEQIDIYADRALNVEVDGDVLRIETAGLPHEVDRALGSPGVSLEVELGQVPLLIEGIRDALRVSGGVCAVDGEPWPCEAVQYGRDKSTPHRML